VGRIEDGMVNVSRIAVGRFSHIKNIGDIMATDQVIAARDILDAVTRVRRVGVERLLQELEQQEPDLAEIVLEEVSLIHQRMTSTGITAKKSRGLIRRIESLILISVTSARHGHRRLWEMQPTNHESKIDSPSTRKVMQLREAIEAQKAVAPTILLNVDDRELATILAALRFHQDENLPSGSKITDRKVNVVSTDAGKFRPLDFDDVDQLCQRLNGASPVKVGMNIESPPRDSGEQQLFRIVYVIDVNAADAKTAAENVYQIMSDPASMPPIVHVLDHAGKMTTIDLSLGADAAASE
jgi:hypothetical protein